MGSARSAAAWLACIVLAVVAPSAHADEKDTCATAAERSQVLRGQGRLREAHEQLLVCVRDACPRVVRADCLKWLGEVDAAQPSIVVHATDEAGKEIADARVLIDGRAVASRSGPDPIVIDPGEHVVRVEAPGLAAAETSVKLETGVRRRLVALVLRASPSAMPIPTATATPTAIPTPTPTPTPTAGVTSTSEPAPEKSRTRVPPVAWLIGATGVAAMGAGGVLWILGINERSDLYTRCGTPGTCAAGDIDASKQSAETKLVVGDIAFGVGVVAVAAAAWLALSSKAPAPDAGLAVTPVIGGAVTSYSARF